MFVGPLLPAAPAEFVPPAWWNEMQLDRRPVVLVTQGTVATGPDELLLPTLEALRDEPVQVIAVTGGPDPADLPRPPANGVPLVVAGASEEKPELVARVNWSGVGVGMRTNAPSPARLRAAVRRVTREPGFACRALALQDEMARYAGPARAADLVAELAGARAHLTRM